MSRIGYKAVELPAGVEVKQDGNVVTVKGPKGELTREFSDLIKINVEGNVVTFERSSDDSKSKSLHGTTRANFHNMVVGVSEGFKKELELRGVGYRAQMQGKKLVLNVGYSHPVEFEEEDGITYETPSATSIIVPVSIRKKLAIVQLAFVQLVHQNLTRAKVFATLANLFVVRKVRLVNNLAA